MMVRVVVVAGVLALLLASRAAAQTGGADVVRRGRAHGGARPPAGFSQVRSRPGAFEFAHGWLARARQVRLNRQALRARGAWRQLNTMTALAGPSTSALAVGGTLRYPTLLPLFKNTTPTDSALLDPAAITAEFWGTAQAPPYSVTTFYREISVGRLTVTGTVLPPIRVSQTDTFYSKGPSCQGLCGTSGVPALIAELIAHADSTVDFSQYVDTSTGFVPAIVILDPQVGGECYQLYPPAANSIWAHRFAYSGWTGAPLTTNDPWPGHPGQFVKIDDYIIQGGQGGDAECSPGVLAPIGTVSHETGHLFGLPDLYDVSLSNQTEGIGRWDLMSEGNEQKPYRPAHMSAWSLATLGWVSEVPITTPQTVVANPIETSDTAYVVPLAGVANEFFLIENRQPIGSDSLMYGPGLMIYHLDTALMAQRLPFNAVNAGRPHALSVEEAAGDTGLYCVYPAACNDRGDAGDPFPGTSGNVLFSAGTRPAASTNAGAFSGVIIDSIAQIAAFGAMRFRLSLGNVTTVWASDTNAAVQVDAATTKVFRDVLVNGSTHTVAIDSVQTSANGRTQYLFGGWSDSLPRQHTITGVLAGATYTAAVSRRYLVSVVAVGTGSVNTSRVIDPVGGSFLADGDTVALAAVAPAGVAFAGWTGDTVAGAPTLTLRMARPYALAATFTGVSDVVSQLLSGKSQLGFGQIKTLDFLGNNNLRFDLGDFVAWLDRNPAVTSATAASRVARRVAR